MKSQPEVSFVLFCKDVGRGAEDTVQEIITATRKIANLKFEIIIVNDGSKTFLFNRNKFKKSVKIINLNVSKGISGAILEGTAVAKYTNLFPIPGHDMYNSDAILNVLKLLGSAPVVLGCRSNLSTERPLAKKIASRAMRDLYRHFFYYYVGDVHGLICYKKIDVERYLKESDRHGQNIRLITNILSNGGLMVQTIAPIKAGHKTQRNINFRNRYPDPKNTFKVLMLLIDLKYNLIFLSKKSK